MNRMIKALEAAKGHRGNLVGLSHLRLIRAEKVASLRFAGHGVLTQCFSFPPMASEQYNADPNSVTILSCFSTDTKFRSRFPIRLKTVG